MLYTNERKRTERNVTDNDLYIGIPGTYMHIADCSRSILVDHLL